ncbi:MAG: 3D domain-containing protein [Clostridia bacterium]|nr:3D domain-containing protein [Clostridia bacterium]
MDEALYTEFHVSDPVNEVVNVGVGGTVAAKDGTVYSYNYRKQMEATAYTYLPPYTTMTTATGETLRKGIVAVDPKVIPLHTRMFITSDKIEYGLGVAEDTGGKIKGNIVDLAYMSYDECIQFGRRQMQVYILD